MSSNKVVIWKCWNIFKYGITSTKETLKGSTQDRKIPAAKKIFLKKTYLSDRQENDFTFKFK